MTRLLVLLLAAIRISATPHLVNIRQLTHGGQNAEAYWSPDGKRLIFQTTRPPYDLRSDLHDECRRLGSAPGFDRKGPHHLRVFSAG